VKPAPFGYHAPRDVDAAVDLLARLDDAKILAGGQSLVPLLSMRLAGPANVVDLNGLTELAYVRTDATGVTVGALARHADLAADAAAARAVPLLRLALDHVAHGAIRNRGTVVGSLVHADPAAELPAVLLLLGGSVEARSVRGTREIPVTELYVGPLETSLQPDEMVVSAHFPATGPSVGTAFLEVARRHGDYAVCGVAALVELGVEDGLRQARAAYIGVAGTPTILDLTAAVTDGPADHDWERAGASARELLRPDADIHASADYRRHLVGVLTTRALAAAAADALADRADPPDRSDSVEPGTRRADRGGRPVPARDSTASGRTRSIALRVNGVPYDIEVEARRLLSDALRHDLGLTGTHVGCEHGVCGCCTVLLDGEPVRSCLLLAASVDGHDVTTVEGCAQPDGSLSPVQQAFRECHGLQCGFCTPGFVTTITAFLETNPDPSDAEAIAAIGGNLCRCTGYQNIVRSVRRAAEIRRAVRPVPPVPATP
jgi:xanthine dehydrogenase iron-sulfur cluster and FAD-binding subunit A